MRVYFKTFGCKTNQYDTEMMRQRLEAGGAETVSSWLDSDVCVVNTCTVTNRADAEARRFIRRLRRENPTARIVVAGCSAARRGEWYRSMAAVDGVVEGHDPAVVARVVESTPRGSDLVKLELRTDLDRIDSEPVGAELLRERRGATRGWLKIQDGCDRKCSFCATRLARGPSRSRLPETLVDEARVLAERHPELVLTGIHIGHYGSDLPASGGRPWTLSRLLARLLERVPDVRFRLGSVEATEVDDLLLDLLAGSGGRVAPHLHMPLQSGSDRVLRGMRRWYTRETYRRRTLEICERMPVLGLGADVITGFPGELPEDHEATRGLIDELPFTYLHVFPFSPREDTVAAGLSLRNPVAQRVAAERSRDLRQLVQAKGEEYRAGRVGQRALVALEGGGTRGLTGDYLRAQVRGAPAGPSGLLHMGILGGTGAHLHIDLAPATTPI